MHKKAIIFDLDNTVYDVRTIGDELFAPLFELISMDRHHAEDLDKIKNEIMRRPFQVVAEKYHFSDELTRNGVEILKNLAYKGKIEPFDDFLIARNLPVDKFLVTTGFLKMQQSKIEGMKLSNVFKEIHIVDPSTTDKTKKDVFADIIHRNGYANSEVLVVGDDPASEIKAAQELKIDAVLYDKVNRYPDTSMTRIDDFTKLTALL